jgi:hypothetical protein
MSETLIRVSARALNPDRPIKALAELLRRPRSTARSWATGHRRPSIEMLEALRDALKERQAQIGQLVPALEYVIAQREREPKHRTGFNLKDPVTGLDKRNRRGRPRRMVGCGESRYGKRENLTRTLERGS